MDTGLRAGNSIFMFLSPTQACAQAAGKTELQEQNGIAQSVAMETHTLVHQHLETSLSTRSVLDQNSISQLATDSLNSHRAPVKQMQGPAQ